MKCIQQKTVVGIDLVDSSIMAKNWMEKTTGLRLASAINVVVNKED